MTTVAIIQARMASTRLPGKVLADLHGRPMLARVIERVRLARRVDQVVVATSVGSCDDPVAAFCASEGIACYRGSESDVLDRYYQAAQNYPADTYVRITADCPLHDPAVIDRVIDDFRRADCDYATNVVRYTYPNGLDTEVFTRAALVRAWHEATRPSEREHVTPYIRVSGQFRVHSVENDVDHSGDHHWSVDNPDDLEFVRAIYRALGDRPFTYLEVLDLLRREPGLCSIQQPRSWHEGYFRSLYQQAVAGAAEPLPSDQSQRHQGWTMRVLPANQAVARATTPVIDRGAGCRLWDIDGNGYIDYHYAGTRAILGHGHPAVAQAVMDQAQRGHPGGLSVLESRLAERLYPLIACTERLHFTRSGTQARTVAQDLARLHTRRPLVAHLKPDVPLSEQFQALRGDYAAFFVEPVDLTDMQPDALKDVRDEARRRGALVIYDETRSGFLPGIGGASRRFGVSPDLVCLGESLANGLPMGVILGRADVLAALEKPDPANGAGADPTALNAALMVLDHLTTDRLERLEAVGKRLQNGFNVLVREAGWHGRWSCRGVPTFPRLRFLNAEGEGCSLTARLFRQETLKRGVLIDDHQALCLAHDLPAIDATLDVYATVLKTLAVWLSESTPGRYLEMGF